MGDFQIVWSGADQFAAAIGGMNDRLGAATISAVDKVALELIKRAKRRATGRPGPNVRTGRLRNSITVTSRVRTGKWGYEVNVSPTVVYARRIDLGFHGTDSLGRHYNQPPYPYFTPSVEELPTYALPIFQDAWDAAMRV